MTAPGTAAARFATACWMGLALGLWYGFLRPLRPKYTALADGAFLAGAVWLWLYLGFGVCGGDLRIGYMAGLAAGGFVWEWTAGQLLRGIFGKFWRFVAGITRGIRSFLKKILKKVKILFASAKKWVTIKWNNRRHSRQKPGGSPNGRIQKSLSKRAHRLPPQQALDEGGRDCRYRIVYGGASDSALDVT